MMSFAHPASTKWCIGDVACKPFRRAEGEQKTIVRLVSGVVRVHLLRIIVLSQLCIMVEVVFVNIELC